MSILNGLDNLCVNTSILCGFCSVRVASSCSSFARIVSELSMIRDAHFALIFRLLFDVSAEEVFRIGHKLVSLCNGTLDGYP